jgi:hypothetical protein
MGHQVFNAVLHEEIYAAGMVFNFACTKCPSALAHLDLMFEARCYCTIRSSKIIVGEIVSLEHCEQKK